MLNLLRKSKLFGSLYYGIKGKASHLKHNREYIRGRDKLEIELRKNINNSDFFNINYCPCCCQNNVNYSFKNPNGFNYDVCKNDGTIYLNPIPTEKTLSLFYQSSIHAYHWLMGRNIDEIKIEPTNHEDLETLIKWAPEKRGKVLLDIGSSNGSFLLNAKRYFQIQGIELNQLTSKVAINNGIPTFNGRVENYEGSKLFDVITMLQVIEHITRPINLIENVRRLLKDDGLFYVNTPNIDSASFNFLKSYHAHVSSFEHVSLFNKESLIKTIEDCGFQLVYADYCFGKDISLHDIISISIKRSKFHHRQALYSPRLYHFSNLFQRLFQDLFIRKIKGHDSYVRAIFRKKQSNYEGAQKIRN